MQLDKLELDLRPRSNMAALDLGFALLRVAPQDTFLAWLALWLPLMLVLTALGCWAPDSVGWLLALSWWVRPLLERAPLYVLSRAVFGESVRWQDAVRAWPRQLGGGWLFLILMRPFTPSRCLRQAIWQLEGARGKVASERYRLISRQGAGSAAVYFGVACSYFENVIEFGILALIGIFFHQAKVVNPLTLIQVMGEEMHSIPSILLTFATITLAGAIIEPIYTACGFTLYLNRRATLEAWDIEITLRQLQPPPQKRKLVSQVAPLMVAVLIPLMLIGMALPTPVWAADAARPHRAASPLPGMKCAPMEGWKDPRDTQQSDASPDQKAVREEIRKIFADDDLVAFKCETHWFPKKEFTDDEPNHTRLNWPKWLAFAPDVLKLVLIVGVACLIIWFFYTFRDKFATLIPRANKPRLATEVGGLDIRPESLPDDILHSVRQLWHNDQRRAALALLYRATLSRLVSQHDLQLSFGATEGDCLRLAQMAHRSQRLNQACWHVTKNTTDLWLMAAYAERWPDTGQVMDVCQMWQQAFEPRPA